MASPTSRISSFTITQPFLGAPLQFQPALGSQELEALIDAYVAGPASKQDKLSEVTIDFYNRATVDLSNGSLVRRYDVALPSRVFGQSPTQSQSSGLSPIYTPSPGSSATFGDSGNASAGMTPPNRTRNSRVSKKAAKKDTKKAVELRLPGFSIMTKDGVDVTSSAGRGTKTKEQREHAHMMRIMKACDDCKRKKVRCDPSHRSSGHGSSGASAATTKTSSPSRQNPSPSCTGTPIEAAHAPSIGDFILFPETDSAWNPADLSMSGFESQPCDLSNFDFDINNIDLNEFTTLNDDSFDWSFTQPNLQVERYPSNNLLIGDSFGFDQWAGLESFSPTSLGNQTSTPLESSDQPASGTQMESSLGVEAPERSKTSASSALQQWPDYLLASPGLFYSNSGSGSLKESITSLSSSSYATSSLDWTAGDSSGSQSSHTDASSPDLARSSSGNSSSWGRPNEQSLHIPGTEDSASYFSRSPSSLDSVQARSPDGDQLLVSSGSLHDHNPTVRHRLRNRPELHDQEHICSVVEEALRAVKSAPDEYLSLSGELGRLRRHLNAMKSSFNDGFDLNDLDPGASSLEGLASELQTLVTRVKNMLKSGRAASVRYSSLDSEQRLLQLNASRLVRSLSATITNLQAPSDELLPDTINSRVPTSARNQQLLVSPDEYHSPDVRLATTLRPELPSPELPSLSVLDSPTTTRAPSLPAGGSLIQEVDIQDHASKQNRNSQLEKAGLILPVMVLACFIATSLSFFPLVAHLAFQVFKFISNTGTLSVGSNPLANVLEPLSDNPMSSLIPSITMVPQPSPLLAVAALMLPLSIGSSRNLVSSSKHISSKFGFRRQKSWNWSGMLHGLSIGSRIL